MNYQFADIIYKCKDISNILNDSAPKYCRPCSRLEIFYIGKILNLSPLIKSILYFTLEPKSKSKIHKDIDLDNKFSNPPHALNLPLANCGNTFMKWYLSSECADPDLFFGGPSSGARTPLLYEENSNCVDTLLCNTPQFVNIQDWHSIENNSSIESRIISLRFYQTISITDIVKKFRS